MTNDPIRGRWGSAIETREERQCGEGPLERLSESIRPKRQHNAVGNECRDHPTAKQVSYCLRRNSLLVSPISQQHCGGKQIEITKEKKPSDSNRHGKTARNSKFTSRS